VSAESGSILVVDDDRTNRLPLARTLERLWGLRDPASSAYRPLERSVTA
jgi:CheY-like chemotaxis protein